MLSQTDLQFLREKIQDLKHAIFFSQNTSLLRMATTIVTLSKMDELGQLWFFVPRPQQALQEFDREFPVRLELLKADYFGSSGELARAGRWWRDLRNQAHGWLFHTHRRAGIAFEAV